MTHTLTRFFCLFIFLIGYGPLKAQWFNRCYWNLNYGYYNHGEFGVYGHIFDHFSVGFNIGKSRIPSGPAYLVKEGFFKDHYDHHKSTYKSMQFFAGVTTHRLKRFDLAFLTGLSHVKANEYIYNADAMYPTPKGSYVPSNKIGIALRLEALFELSTVFGLNISMEQQFNGIRNNFSVVAGINVGIVRDYHTEYGIGFD